MDKMGAAWQFLKDYETYIPGVEGQEGMNTSQWLPEMPESGDRRWHDRFTDPGTKARMRAYKLQQAKFAQQMRDWYRDSRMSGPTPEPRFWAGPHEGHSRDWLHAPGDKPRLVTADVDTDDQREGSQWVKPIGAGEILPRNILGEGGYLQALANWLQGNDTTKYGRERGLANLVDSPREFRTTREWEVGPEEEKPEEEKPEEEKTEEGKPDPLRERRSESSLEDATNELDDDWHKGFNKKGEHHPEDQSWGIYGDKLKLVHKKNFTVDPPESGRDNLHDFMDNKLLGGKDGPKAYYKSHMKDKLTKLFKENPKAGIKWLRAHPGWEEAIPDDFVWRDMGTASQESEKKKKTIDAPDKPPPVKGGSLITDDDEVSASVDQLDPMDTAWAVLKLG